MASTTIRFGEEDLTLFSDASGDRNPLHLSAEYARRTAYGQPVVFGCLGAIACLGQIHLPEGLAPVSIRADFLRPMFLGVEYRVEPWQKNGKWGVKLFDGTVQKVSLTVTAGPAPLDSEPAGSAAPVFPSARAAARQEEELVPGLQVSGDYAVDPARLDSLTARWSVDGRLCGIAAALCWASYCVGMEVPGESALFSKVVLAFNGAAPVGLLRYSAAIASVDDRFGQIEIDVRLDCNGTAVASGQCWSFVRPPVPEEDDLDLTGVRPDSLAGRTAVLVGSSRGLGAAMKRAFEARGAAVYGLARSADGQDPNTEAGDAADPAALRRLRDRISKERGRVDFLICNACPPILPLRIEPGASGRVSAYIQEAVSLALEPLAEFLDLLDESRGCAVIISSSAVENPPREWPHYVAAKQAVEALGAVAALQYPRVRTLIVRPPKLLTGMTNTPLGRMGAASPGVLANRIAERMETPPESGKTEYFS